MKTLFLSLAVVLLCGASPTNLADHVPAKKGALVITHKAGVGNMCGFMSDNDSLYLGPATLMVTPRGKTNGQCVMYLVEGPGIDHVYKYDGAFEWPGMGVYEYTCVVTPGNAAACQFHSPR